MSNSQGYDNLSVPYAYATETVMAGAVLPAVGILVVALRFYVRSTQKWAVGIDDWLMLPALLAVIGMGATLITGAALGAIGYPTPGYTGNDPLQAYTIIDPPVAITQEIDYANTLCMIAAYGFIKLSILFYYRRLFVAQNNSSFDIVTKISVAAILIWTLAFFLRFVFYCGSHFAANWNGVYDAAAYCPAGDGSNEALVVSELITNIFVICLPLPIVWSLNMSTSRKIGVVGLLLLAAMSIVASILRLIVAFDLIDATTAGADIDPDLSITTILYWSTIEAGIALITANLPSIWSVLARIVRGTGDGLRTLTGLSLGSGSRYGPYGSNRSGRAREIGASYGPATPGMAQRSWGRLTPAMGQSSWGRLRNDSPDSRMGLRRAAENDHVWDGSTMRDPDEYPQMQSPQRTYAKREGSSRGREESIV